MIDFSPILKIFLPFQGAEIVWIRATYSTALFLSCLESCSSFGDYGILFKLHKKNPPWLPWVLYKLLRAHQFSWSHSSGAGVSWCCLPDVTALDWIWIGNWLLVLGSSPWSPHANLLLIEGQHLLSSLRQSFPIKGWAESEKGRIWPVLLQCQEKLYMEK